MSVTDVLATLAIACIKEAFSSCETFSPTYSPTSECLFGTCGKTLRIKNSKSTDFNKWKTHGQQQTTYECTYYMSFRTFGRYKVLSYDSTYPQQPRICLGNGINKKFLWYLCLNADQVISFYRECIDVLPFDKVDCRLIDKGDHILEVCFCSRYFCLRTEDSALILSANIPLVLISIFAMILFTAKDTQMLI